MWDVSIKIMKSKQAMTCVTYLHTSEEMRGIIHVSVALSWKKFGDKYERYNSTRAAF